ncbi:hypothetical protein [Mucilaginibacter sp.]|uniref:hypothetical protein n=1 Tax=Mucilaginibacter sp. TaxID=1882438 RepID=UPI0025EE119D|nr:hypothetical protein [Mucilaginibacter sp.]
MDKQALKKLFEALPWGGITAIAKQVGVANDTVKKVLDGRSDNMDVLTAAVEFMEKHKTKQNELNAKVASLVN